jgi:ribonuclease BN (tRNA processing enzyme)
MKWSEMSAEGKEMTVVILGSGTCVPSLSRSACAAVAAFADVVFLLDIGPGTMRRLLEAGFSVFDVTHIGISHHHPDHTGELASFLFANQYPDASQRDRPLTLIGARGLAAFFRRLQGVYGEWIDCGGRLSLLELSDMQPDETPFPNFRLQSAPVCHRPESIAFRIDGPAGDSVVFSGDTDYSESLVRLAAGADLLICESALPEEMKVEGHLSPSLAGRIAEKAGVGQLVLTHLYPPCEGADMIGPCRSAYSGRICLARDLLCLRPGESK